MIEVDLEDPDIEPIGERAREMLAAATTADSYLTQEQTTTPLDTSTREQMVSSDDPRTVSLAQAVHESLKG